MERSTAITKERNLNIKARIGESSVPKRLVFTNEDGSAHDITSYDFELLVKRQPGANTNIFRLSIDDGLTIEGDDNELVFEVTDEQADQKPNVYFHQIRSVAQDKTWFSGDWEFFYGKYDNEESCETTSVSICEDGETILVTVLNCSETDTNTRTSSTTSTATLTPNVDSYDLFVISAQAEALTIANPTGTAVLGNGFMIDLDDNGSARALTFGNLYDDTFVDLPTTTIASKRMKMVFQYNGTNWELLNVINEQ